MQNVWVHNDLGYLFSSHVADSSSTRIVYRALVLIIHTSQQGLPLAGIQNDINFLMKGILQRCKTLSIVSSFTLVVNDKTLGLRRRVLDIDYCMSEVVFTPLALIWGLD